LQYKQTKVSTYSPVHSWHVGYVDWVEELLLA